MFNIYILQNIRMLKAQQIMFKFHVQGFSIFKVQYSKAIA